MKINILTLRFALILIVFKMIGEVAVAMTIATYFDSIELGITIQKGLSILLGLIETYLLYYFFVFLNQVLLFKKLNLFLWILIVSYVLQIIFYHIMKIDANEKGWGLIVWASYGLLQMFARIGLFIRQFKYRGSFRLNLMIYGFALIVPIISQIVLVLLTVIDKDLGGKFNPNTVKVLMFLPSIALFFIFYKALKESNFQEEKSSSSALDGGEFSH